MVKIIETPRDGFQGLMDIIPTQTKIDYINLLLKCGFNTVEVGSFVSPRAIPQMFDTAQVLDGIDINNTSSDIAILVATTKGGIKAMDFEIINQIFFPFAVSPNFLKRNIKQTIEEAETTIDSLQNLCVKNGKELIVYFSMAFGSAYGDDWSIDLLHYWIKKMIDKGLRTFPFSDVLGVAKPEVINEVFSSLKSEFTNVEFGFHMHSTGDKQVEKIDAAYKAGIRRFDTVINGLGGCPQTGKELVGNLPLDVLMRYFESNKIDTTLNKSYLAKASNFSIY